MALACKDVGSPAVLTGKFDIQEREEANILFQKLI